MKRSFKKASAGRPPGTREEIRRAAMRVLARDGLPALTARNVAAEAGTNLALLNYHFGSKERLLLDLFEALNADRLERQRQLYADPAEPLSAKWRRAVEYYRRDLADGYVRVLQELTALGYSRPLIGRRVRERIREWRLLLAEVARKALPELGITAEPSHVAGAVASFWWGMEVQHLIGVSESDGKFFVILDEVGDWLEGRERRARGGKGHARARAI